LKNGTLRHLAIALSLANLCYLRIWSEILTYRHADTYLMKAPPPPVEYLAVMTNVLLAGAVFWGLITLAGRKWSQPMARFVQIGFLVSLLIPLNALRSVLSNYFPYLKSPLFELLGTNGVVVLAVALALAAVAMLAFFRRSSSSIAAAILAALSPFCAVTFGQAIWKSLHYDDREYVSLPLSPPLPAARNSPRVIWFICDEWDYRLTFENREPGLQLPEIDRLRTESFFARNAFPPGPETPVSIPGYYCSRLVEGVQYDGPRELQIRYRGKSQAVPWSSQPNVFQHARQLGFNTALVEWFHPSCRVIGGLAFCRWWEMAMQHNSMGVSFWQILPNQTRSLFETTLFSPFGQSLPTIRQAETYHAILQETLAIANNPDYGFAMVHLPIPHAPHAYDRRTGQFTLANSPIRGYVDSLTLLDRTVGEIRRSMEAAATWDRSTLLFTSDHPYREAEQLDGKPSTQIPYVLKMASQKQSTDYTQPFNAIVSSDLLLAVLRGDIADAAAAAKWLDQNRTRFPIQ
jgi:hypothetical protein